MPDIHIVVTAPLLPSLMQDLENSFICHRLWEAADQDAFFAEAAPVARGLVVSGKRDGFADVLERLPKLEVVSNFGVGVDNVDVEYCRRHGIAVGNTPDVLTEDVADLTMALLVSVARGVAAGDRYIRAGRWLSEGRMALARTVGHSSVGIVGMGRIGRAFARRAEVSGTQIAYTGRSRKEDLPYPYYPSVLELARVSDFLVLCAPGGEETFHLVNEAVISAMGPRGVLINIGRGSLVDEVALTRALQEGRLGGAGLDVFEHEPELAPGLAALENVVLTPHIGSATQETRRAMGDLVFGNLMAHFQGRELPARVV